MIMAIQCADTDTLVQTYLDGELAENDASILQSHLAECAPCARAATDEARTHAFLREKLAPPPMPTHMRDRVMEALERDDWQSRRQRASRWSWILPAAASLAAAAALVLFIVSNNQPENDRAVAEDAVRQHTRPLPIEVAGNSVPVFVREHLSPVAHVPRFSSTATNLRGARLSHLGDRDAALVFYETRLGSRLYDVSALIFDARDMHVCSGRAFDIGGRDVCVTQIQGFHVATHKGDDGIGYIFISEMDALTMLDFVKTSDLLLRASDKRVRGGR
jgi:anti-sigma factor RsiW